MNVPPDERHLPATLRLSEISVGRQLGQGGQGRVVEVTAIRGIVPDSPLVLKTYADPGQLNGRALARAVVWRRSLDKADRIELDRCCAWPIAVTTVKDWPVGVAMRRVGPEFADSRRLPSGSETTLLREAQFLIAPDSILEARGIRAADLDDRVEVLGAFASALALLHRLGVVVGDISVKNILWRIKPAAVLLLDCDGMRLVGSDPPMPPVSSPGWQDPAFVAGQSHASDVYKFALFMVRVLSQQFQANSPEAARMLGPVAAQLASASLSLDPAIRPTAEQWRSVLCQS